MRIMAVIALAVSGGAAHSTDREEIATACENTAKIAESVMIARQDGMPALAAMDYYLEQARAEMHELYTMLIVQAYEVPQYLAADVRERAIRDFTDETWTSCMQSWLQAEVVDEGGETTPLSAAELAPYQPDPKPH